MMVDYKPNSNKSKTEQKRVSAEKPKLDKVVTGTVKTKKNEIRKIKDVFIAEDIRSIKDYIIMDVLVPTIKNAIEDIITNGTRMILRGETTSRKSRSDAERVSYRRYYDDRRDDRRHSDGVRRAKPGYSYDDIIYESRGEAEAVLDRMVELIEEEEYGMASVADLFELSGVTGNHTDNKYGWTNVRTAEVQRVREGYIIKLPPARPLD